MLKGKSLTNFINLFLQNNFKANDDTILNCFKEQKLLSLKQCYPIV